MQCDVQQVLLLNLAHLFDHIIPQRVVFDPEGVMLHTKAQEVHNQAQRAGPDNFAPAVLWLGGLVGS